MKKIIILLAMIAIAFTLKGQDEQKPTEKPTAIRVAQIVLVKRYTPQADTTLADVEKDVYGYFKVVTYRDPFPPQITFWESDMTQVYSEWIVGAHVDIDDGIEYIMTDRERNIIFLYSPGEKQLCVVLGQTYGYYDIVASNDDWLIEY